MQCTNSNDRKNAVVGAACHGDLGGPALILDKNQRWRIYAVIKSTGEQCDTIGVTKYTKVVMFNEWIQATIKKSDTSLRPTDPKQGQLDRLCGYNPRRQTTPSPAAGKKNKNHKRIINGRFAYVGEVPWFARVMPSKCGGVIISKEFVLTVTHCLEHEWYSDAFLKSLVLPLKIIAGVYNLDTTEYFQQSINVAYTIKYPGFNEDLNSHTPDMALLKLKTPLTWTDYVRPACLPPGPPASQSYTPTDILVAGYGLTVYSANPLFPPTSSRLKVAAFPFIRDVQDPCSLYSINQTIKFCMPSVWKDKDGNEQAHAFCNGDSGGPALYERVKDRWEVFGLVSSGVKECLYYDLTLERLSFYREWFHTLRESYRVISRHRTWNKAKMICILLSFLNLLHITI